MSQSSVFSVRYEDLPKKHFLYNPPDIDSPYHIARLYEGKYVMLLIINPTDARKRLILRFIGKSWDDKKESLSRKYTEEELSAFYSCASKLMYKFQDLGAQLSYAGNNSQSVENDVIVIGKREPSMLHLHIVFKFLLPLDQIGKEFSLMGPKEKWTEENLLEFRKLILTYMI